MHRISDPLLFQTHVICGVGAHQTSMPFGSCAHHCEAQLTDSRRWTRSGANRWQIKLLQCEPDCYRSLRSIEGLREGYLIVGFQCEEPEQESHPPIGLAVITDPSQLLHAKLLSSHTGPGKFSDRTEPFPTL